MRIAKLCLMVGWIIGCSSSSDDPSGAGGAAGSPSGAAGLGGSTAQPTGGSSSSAGASTSGGASTGGKAGGGGGASSGGSPTGAGNTNGGSPSGGSTNGGNASGGSAGGGSAGGGNTNGGSAGGGSCVKNLACKLDPPPTTGDLQQDCVDRINQFLTKCACLPALKRRTDGEACANQMAKYDADQNKAHAGAQANICQPGGSQNSCPGYSSNNQVIGLCLQQMWDEGPPPTENCTGQCYQDHGHFINMTDDSVTQVACGFYTTASGKVWAVQNFSR